MDLLISLLVLLSSFLFFTAMLQMLFLSNKKLEKRLKHYLVLNDKQKLNRKRFNLLVQIQLYKAAIKNKVLSKQKNESLAIILQRAGLPLKPEEYILFQWISMALCGGVLLLVTNQTLFLLVGVILGFFLPKMWVKKKERQRLAKFNDGLEDMITTVIGSLRAGFSFAQSLMAVVDESEEPIKEEIETLLKEMQYGTSMEDALNHLKERVPSGDLDLLIQSVLIQRQVGGNLATVLGTIVQTIRDRNRIQRQVRTLTAQGRMSGLVIGFLPVGIALVLYLIQPSYIGTLFHDTIGLISVGVAVILGSIGLVLIRKITTIEV
jgi:tight adherence protein B